MKYYGFRIILSKKALKQLEKIPKKERAAVVEKIDLLLTQSHNLDIKKLQGYYNLYRLRVGDYRVVFRPEIESSSIKIGMIAHRKEVYEMLEASNLMVH